MIRLAWRNLFQSTTQIALGVGGVALALLLMLALDALLAGSEDDLVAYIEDSGADIFVSQEGVKNMHMASSAITRSDLRLVAQIEGVATVSPILYITSVVETKKGDVLSYIIGFDPKEPLGGPREVVDGTLDIHKQEIIIDQAVARSREVELGDIVEIFGEEYTVVGITAGLTNIVNSVSFITLRDFQDLRGDDRNVVSYALVKTLPDYSIQSVAAQITARDPDVLALSEAEFSRGERQIIRDMSVEVLNIMNVSGFLIGLAVTALTLYSNTLHKRSEYGVLKAIGAKNIHLYTVVVAQAFISLFIGALLAIGFILLLGQLLPMLVPGVAVTLTATGLLRVLTTSIIIGGLSALAPAFQIARLDPAEVFRG